MITKIYNFLEVVASFDLAPAKAIEYFAGKGLRESFDWRDMIGQEHDNGFTVAKMMDTDLLATVQEKLTRALEQGTTFEQFARELMPQLQKAGWWGKKDVVDPLTGKLVTAQLGSASRLETIFRSNLQSAYSVGRWNMIQRNVKTAPYLLYDAVDDHRTREEHARWDETVLPVGNAFWFEFMPPNGWNCRCGVIQLSEADLKDYGLKVSKPPKIKRRRWVNPRTGKAKNIPVDIDPGWNNNPGANRLAAVKETAEEKRKVLTPEQAAAVAKTPKPQRPDIELSSTLTLDEIKERGKPRLETLLNQTMTNDVFEGKTRLQILEELAADRYDKRHEAWAEDFLSSLLTDLSAVRPITTPAKVASGGKGAKAVIEASKRYPDDWTAAADGLGPLFVKFSSKRGYQITTEREYANISDFGWAYKTLPSVDGQPVKWPKGSGFIITDDSSTAAHEYAHRLQYALADLDNYFNEEHRRRTTGDPLKRLRDITGFRYSLHEKTREDGYYDAYMGKEYDSSPAGRPAMEVMTMAFEPLLGNPSHANAVKLVRLLTLDPDMARLALGLLFHYKVPEVSL